MLEFLGNFRQSMYETWRFSSLIWCHIPVRTRGIGKPHELRQIVDVSRVSRALSKIVAALLVLGWMATKSGLGVWSHEFYTANIAGFFG